MSALPLGLKGIIHAWMIGPASCMEYYTYGSDTALRDRTVELHGRQLT